MEVEQNVLRLEIAVDDAVLVNVLKHAADFRRVQPHAPFAKVVRKLGGRERRRRQQKGRGGT